MNRGGGGPMAKAAAKVGCCGFPVSWEKYFEALGVVEIQQTFYQPPKPQTARRWRDEAPDGFEFTVKAWQLITHEASSPTYRRLRTPLSEEERRQVDAFRWTDPVRRAWETTLQTARLLGADKVLFQCPAGFKPTQEHKDRMRRFFGGIERGGLVCIWEPRGEWRPEEIAGLCQELNLVHCVDPFQAEPATSGLGYYRLHGIGGYRHEYTDGELAQLRGYAAAGSASYFLFNNVTMWDDALRLREVLKRAGA